MYTVRQRTDTQHEQCTNDSMQTPRPAPALSPQTPTPKRDQPGQAPVTPQEPDFPERHDDPEQAEELERQQDA